ncbi:MAG TPA: hypothetical protein VGH81_13245 [Rudaea sp.]
MLAALLAATAAGAQTTMAAQRVQFSGADAVFGVLATASAQVTLEPQFLRVTLEPGVIRATAVAKVPQRVIGYRINLGYTRPSGEWDMLRKSERAPLDIVLDHLDTFAVTFAAAVVVFAIIKGTEELPVCNGQLRQPFRLAI